MSIDIKKPAPLQIGNRYYYTLTSYDPVSIEVEVPCVTDEDVDYALESVVTQAGGTSAADATDDFVKAHFHGVESVSRLRDAVREQVGQMNSRMVEDSKPTKCAAELAKRLRQAVPETEVTEVRQELVASFRQELSQEGLSPEDFLARSGASRSSLDAMFDREARESAEQAAALEAYVEEKKLKVDEAEIPGLLRLSAADAEKLVGQAKASGAYEQVERAALRNKAARALAAECSCTYHHETPEEAEKRIAQYRQLETMATARDANPGKGAGTPGDGSDLKLV